MSIEKRRRGTDALEELSDFTYEMYARLLETGLDSGYAFLTVSEYLAADELPDRFIILRHDVDRKPENALDFSRLEGDRGIAATYYFRTIEKTFRPALIRRIDELGHEIGYHYEDVDRADGQLELARASFEVNLERLRRHAPVTSVCMHGNPLTRYDNRELWQSRAQFADYGLLGEAYLSVDFTDVTYFSDTGRTWRDGTKKIKDHTVGADAKTIQIDTTQELCALVESGKIDRFYILTHPNRWAGTPFEFIGESAKDAATNAAKYVIQAVNNRR